jgi:hypothetical protein
MPGAVLANLLLAPARPLRLDIPGAREMSERSSGWSRKFDEPIAPADGRRLVTLHDAASYITALPDEESSAAEWQAAIEALMLVVDLGGITMMARMGVMRVLNRKNNSIGSNVPLRDFPRARPRRE